MDSFFGLDKEIPPMSDLELLVTVNDRIYQSIIESILTDNEIPFISKERGSGAAVKVITGFSLFGTDIFVLKSHIERARELLSELESADVQLEDDEDLSDDEV